MTVPPDIEAIHGRLKALLADLESLDATILQFDPTHRVEAIRPRSLRPPADWSNKGQMSRIVLSILRQAAEPLTTRDIALELHGRAGDGQAGYEAAAADDQAGRGGTPDPAG